MKLFCHIYFLGNLDHEYRKSIRFIKLTRYHLFLKQAQSQLVSLFNQNFLQVLLAFLNKSFNLFSDDTKINMLNFLNKSTMVLIPVGSSASSSSSFLNHLKKEGIA